MGGVGRGYRGLSSNGKYTIKINLKKKYSKVLSILRIGGHVVNLRINMYKKPTGDIIPNDETQIFSTKIRNKAIMSPLTTLLQHCTRVLANKIGQQKMKV